MTIPILGGAPFPFRPYSNIAPFSASDGATYLDVLEELRDYIRDELTPFVNTEMLAVVAAFAVEVNGMILQVTSALNVNNASVGSQLSNQNNVITAQIAAQNIAAASQIADLTTFVNTSVQAIINSTIAVSDPVMTGVFNNTTTEFRKAIDKKVAAVLVVGLGIDPTGIANSNVAIQALFDANPNRVMQFPIGTFKAGIITVPVGSSVKGESRSSSTILGGLSFTQAQDVFVSDITINGLTFNSNGISARGAHRFNVARVVIINAALSGLSLLADFVNTVDSPVFFSSFTDIEVISPGGGKGVSLSTVNGSWATSNMFTNVSVRGDTGNTVAVGVYVGGNRCVDNTFVQTYSQHCGIAYHLAVGAERTRIIGSFAEDSTTGYKVESNNLTGFAMETATCVTPWAITGFLNNIISQGKMLFDSAVSAPFNVVSPVSQYTLAHPGFKKFSIGSLYDFGKTLSIRNETDNSDVAYWSSNGVMTIPGKIARLKAVKTVSGNIVAADDVTICNGATLAMALPSPAEVAGQTFTVKNINSTAVTIVGGLSSMIDGQSNSTIAQWGVEKFYSTGAEYVKL